MPHVIGAASVNGEHRITLEEAMELALIVAVIRGLALEKTEKKLQEIGVRGITVTRVKGYGEYANFFTRDRMTDDVKIEVFAAKEKAERIAGAILDAAHTGSPGDGIVAILPVDRVFSARTRAEAIPNQVRESD